MAKMLKITLAKSTIGAVPKNKAIVESMGLRKTGKSVILPDNDATRGQIRLVSHLLKVEEVEEITFFSCFDNEIGKFLIFVENSRQVFIFY